jgi:large subunit ribosomal protein L18
MELTKEEKRKIRGRRSVLLTQGSFERPRVTVFRSNMHIYAQAVNDENHTTLASISSSNMKSDRKTKSETALLVGSELARLLKEQNINTVKFDRNGYRYHGVIKNVAQGLRDSGIIF